MSANLRPRQDDVGARDGLALRRGETCGDGLDLGAVDVEGDAGAVVAKGRVGGDVDVLGGGVLDELGLG